MIAATIVAGSATVASAAMPVLLSDEDLRAAVARTQPDILVTAKSSAELFAAAEADVVATSSAVHLAATLAATEAQPPFQPNKLQVLKQWCLSHGGG